MNNPIRNRIIVFLVISIIMVSGCSQAETTPENLIILDRHLKIPADAVKILPETDT